MPFPAKPNNGTCKSLHAEKIAINIQTESLFQTTARLLAAAAGLCEGSTVHDIKDLHKMLGDMISYSMIYTRVQK